jgi:arylsulfatase
MRNGAKRQTRRQFLRSMGVAVAAPGTLSGLSHVAPWAGQIRRPNILLFLPDQHRFDWLGTTAGISVPTPNLDRMGKEGAHFTWAVCPSPLSAPSRACLASGKEYDRNGGVESNKFNYPVNQTTYYTLLRDAGYHVIGCGKFDLDKAVHNWGLDGRHPDRLINKLGFSDGIDNAGKGDGVNAYVRDKPANTPKDPYYHYLSRRTPPLDKVCADDMAYRYTTRGNWGKYAYTDPIPEAITDEHYVDNWIGRNGLQLLDEVPEGKPWHLVVNFNGPHNPMDITKSMAESYRGPKRVIEGFPQPNAYTGDFTPEDHVRIRQNYSAMIENIDRWLGVYIDKLAERGELDNTIIVYSSDHGEMLGDHDRWGKTVPYQPSVGIPLFIKVPGMKPLGKSSALVSLMDLTATFLDYAGVPVPPYMDSRSLRALLEGRRREHREYVLSGLMNWRMVFDGRYKLIEGYGSRNMLFDLANDLPENENIAEKLPKEVARLRELNAAGRSNVAV